MNKKQTSALTTQLLPSFPSFKVKGRLMLLAPLGDTLRAFHFEPSGFSLADFYINVFFQPLYVPSEHAHFTFGHRLGPGWTITNLDVAGVLRPKMLEEVAFLAKLGTAEQVAKELESQAAPNMRGYVNPHCFEARAYALLKAGHVVKSKEVLQDLLDRANREVGWENEIAVRAQMLLEKLLNDPNKARDQLAIWQTETVRNLELEEFQ
jgi:hypothetical protein